MIDGWVTGTVDGRPRITTKSDAETVAIKLRVVNGAGPTIYANAFASDEEPMEALTLLRHGDVVMLFGALVLRAWAGKGEKAVKPGLDIAVSSVVEVQRRAPLGDRSAHARARNATTPPETIKLGAAITATNATSTHACTRAGATNDEE
ncbi:hypothetical protein [Burkholderia seminalis]|uniref:hypothetical protein n=1 Tax=Burkholderia seminalis TaxID=488731 RepID=UPI000AADE3DD|nr:hypothetical protein [Burkholderia seminalis]